VLLSFRNVNEQNALHHSQWIPIFQSENALHSGREELENLLYLFNPSELIEQYGWHSTVASLQ